MKLKLQLFLIALLIISSSTVFGQISFDSPEELEKAANEAFDAEQYEKAKPLFSQLLSLNALNANYNYRFGVCVLYTEDDPLKPLPYIEGGANTSGVNPEAFYFLGKAYQLNYRFDEAITYFEKAKKSSFSANNVDLARSIQECRNGKLLYNEAIEFDPAQDKEVIEGEFYRPYDFRKLKGKVIPMPPSFKTKYDEKNLKGTFVYTPSNSQSLFYASYGNDGANAKDLYRVNRLPNGEWALPQRLPSTINTKYDEDFAFYDDESQTLYFASKGHNTMGGYDVFRSVYNAEKNEWSPPINLQFPINSPYDDFLYVSDPSGKVAFFTSKRETEIGKIRVFKTLLYDPEQVELSVVEGTFEDKTDSIYNYMLATVFDPKTNQVIGKYRSNKETGKYVLILPPQNDYSMDVGPREASGFKFDLDVPKHEPTKPLQQNLTYDTQAGEGTVTMTNFFDAAGEPDSVAFAMNRSKEDVESEMVEMPDPSEILAAREAERDEIRKKEEAKLAELAAAEDAKFAAEKAKQDSLIAAKQIAFELEAARLKAEAAKKDSIASAAQLAQEKQRQQAIADSISKAQAAEVEKQLAAEREKAIADSIVNAEELAMQKAAEREEFVADSMATAQADELQKQLAADREKAIADSIAKAEAVELERQLALEREKAIADSIVAAEELALQNAAEREKSIADSIATAEKLARQIAMEEAKVDSLETVTEKVRKDSVAELERLALEMATADSISKENELAAQREMQFADSIAEAEASELEIQLAAERKRAIADSIAEIERLALAELEKVKADSIAAVAAEKERLAEIEREVEEAKARALRDSVVEMDVAETKTDSEESSFQDLLKEMQEKEAEILAQEKSTKSSTGSEAEANDQLEEPGDAEEELAQQVKDSLGSKDVISEADLFLQTIADLEEQKQQQEAEIAAENELLNLKKEERAKLEAAKRDSLSKVVGAEMAMEGDSVLNTETVKVDGEKDLEQESLALKSNADPNEYLKALAEMEAEMAEDDARNSKSYELQDLKLDDEVNVDATLEQKVAKDREAVESHQRIAAKKEAALKEQMQRDMEVVKGVTAEEADEIAAIEAEMLEGIENQKQSQEAVTEEQETLIAEADELVKEEQSSAADSSKTETEAVVEEVRKDAIEAAEEVKEEVVETSTESKESEVEELTDLEEELVAESGAVFEEVINEDVPAEVLETEGLEPESTEELEQEATAEEKQETIVETEEELVAEADQAMEEILEAEQVETAEIESGNEELVEQAEEITTPEEVLEDQKPVEEPAAQEEIATSESGVGRIPFLTPAMRDYSKLKADFSGIEDKTMKRMVQRMRSEDVGRLAVLKNMKNEWIDAGKTQESLQEIKSNTRNKDVLADLGSRATREEKNREPFNKNDLRERQNVWYKLDLKLTSEGVSETVAEAMTPEQSMTFFMPEFEISTGYFTTLADVKSEKRFYQKRGFETVRIVVFHNGEQITLSDVTSVPFVD